MVVPRFALERRRHLRHRGHRLALVVEGHVHEHLRAEILDGPDVRRERTLPDADRLRPEPDDDPIAAEGGQARRHLGVELERRTHRREPPRP